MKLKFEATVLQFKCNDQYHTLCYLNYFTTLFRYKQNQANNKITLACFILLCVLFNYVYFPIRHDELFQNNALFILNDNYTNKFYILKSQNFTKFKFLILILSFYSLYLNC